MTTNNARIYIAGGYGLVGSTIARHIRKINKDIEIVLAGRNPDNGIPLAIELGHSSTAYLDLENNPDFRDISNTDLIIAALHDPADFLVHTALTLEIAYMGISKMADEVVPITFETLKTFPKRPIVHLSHWQAGVLTIIAQKITEQFSQIHTIATAGLYDSLDPIGPMVAKDVEGFVGQALLRKNGKWLWDDAQKNVRMVLPSDGNMAEGYPMATLDVPSLASITGAPNVRFDFVHSNSLGSSNGNKASHDLYIEIEGALQSGMATRIRTLVSDPNGQAHMTALGVLVATERILGLDGHPAADGGLHLPETLLQPDRAIARFKQFGVQITQIEEL